RNKRMLMHMPQVPMSPAMHVEAVRGIDMLCDCAGISAGAPSCATSDKNDPGRGQSSGRKKQRTSAAGGIDPAGGGTQRCATTFRSSGSYPTATSAFMTILIVLAGLMGA